MMGRRSIYVFLGPPGSGKGTVADLCERELGWRCLATGNLCRREIKSGSEMGKKIDFAIKSGKLVSDGLILELVNREVQSLGGSDIPIMLDGFPRTVEQAKKLDEMLYSNYAESKTVIVHLEVSPKTVCARLRSRFICSNVLCQSVYALEGVDSKSRAQTCARCFALLERRDDDSEVNVQKRLGQYYEHEQALLDYFEERHHTVHTVCVEPNLKTVFEDLTSKLCVGPYDCN